MRSVPKVTLAMLPFDGDGTMFRLMPLRHAPSGSGGQTFRLTMNVGGNTVARHAPERDAF
jgi:hypothetical protein